MGAASLGLGEDVSALGLLDRNLNLGLLELLAVHTDAGLHDVAGDDGANTLGRSGKDDVALLNGEDLGDVTEHLGDLEQHELRRVVLLDLVVDGQVQLDVVGVGNGRLGNDVAQGQEGIEALGYRPGKALLLGLPLGVPGRHVNAEGIAWLAGQRAGLRGRR